MSSSSRAQWGTRLFMGVTLGLIGFSFLIWCVNRIFHEFELAPFSPLASVVLGAIMVSSMIFVAERLVPLRSLDQDAWIYRYRPSGRLPLVGFYGLFQVLTFASFGFLVGFAISRDFKVASLLSALVGIVRFAGGWLPHESPASLLRKGSAMDSLVVSSFVLDSQLTSDLSTLTWIRNYRRPIFSNPWMPVVLHLTAARVIRRSYALWLGLSILCGALIFTPFFDWAGYAVFGVAMIPCVAAVRRSCTFDRTPEYDRLFLVRVVRVAVVVFCSSILPVVFWVTGGNLSHRFLMLAMTVGIYFGARERAKIRRFNSFSLIDAGIGVLVPLEVVVYWTSGGIYAFAVAVCAALAY